MVSVEDDIETRDRRRKKPPGNRAASLFRENSSNGGKPSELSGEILWAEEGGVKAKSLRI
jgi:hypothetical protein